MDVRKTFLEFFEKEGHLLMPSSSLVPRNDPSVLLTTAGMQQFKPYYLGTEKPPRTRIATVQKCFRTSDIDSVGYTDRHLTFFEMLGNFSFGDYFKKEAIRYAIDFCVDVLNLPKKRLMAAVFSGDKDIPPDEESIQYWVDNGIDKDRIYRFGRDENFWGPAGTTGPCGPCTEIYYDFGPQAGCGKDNCDPGCECGRFLEIWNLVFTQYNFDGRGYEELPKKNIDTGMGLERIIAVLENQTSVFRTSLFQPILNKVFDLTGKRLGGSKGDDRVKDQDTDRALRILADHCRASYFLLGDGVTPSNEGRGYILRRIIRRAVRFGKKLGMGDHFLNDIGQVVLDEYSGQYEELSRKKDISFKIIEDEENRFNRTLEDGSAILNDLIDGLKQKKKDMLDPRDAFRLYETYGFPVELTGEILAEHGLGLDPGRFQQYFDEHVDRSRKKTSFDKKVDMNIPIYKKISCEHGTEFLGYEKEELNTSITGLIRLDTDGSGKDVDELSAGEKGEIILGSTVFYGERGGQTGDTGMIKSGGGIFTVDDTVIPVEDIFVHRGQVKEGKLAVGDEVYIEIDHRKRRNTRKNHTSTHLLHWALRNTLGDQVKQSGSSVSDSGLRFDYSIYKGLDKKQLQKIEKIVNEKIQKDDPVRCFETTMDYAREIDAVALFDEKYGEFVRVVEIDDYNRELCGGTHVRRTGEIGLFKIISDSSIGSNLRRIEAVTGMHAYDMLITKEERLRNISEALEVGEEKTESAVKQLKQDCRRLNQELKKLKIETMTGRILGEIKGIKAENGYNILGLDLRRLEVPKGMTIDQMGEMADRIKEVYGNKSSFIAMGNIINEKPVMILTCTQDISKKYIDCGSMARVVGKIIKGGGGGRPAFAQLGGSDAGSLDRAIDLALEEARKSLGLK